MSDEQEVEEETGTVSVKEDHHMNTKSVEAVDSKIWQEMI